MVDVSLLTAIGQYILYLLVPILTFYVIYLIITRAFNDMGFSSLEAIIIVFISALFGFVNITIGGVSISNIYLFSVDNWMLSINMGGAVIPILLSIYLVIKHKLPLKKIALGIVMVTAITFFVTTPDAERGIISHFPYWLLPIFAASIVSVFFSRKEYCTAAPLAYICGTLGVLIGADFLHLPALLLYPLTEPRNAIIGGANVFDMIFITGILAVIVDGILMYRQRKQASCTLET